MKERKKRLKSLDGKSVLRYNERVIMGHLAITTKNEKIKTKIQEKVL